MIEPPQPEDVPAIERIAEETGAFTSAEIRIIREMLEAFFHPEPRDDHTFLVYRDPHTQALAGFACFGPTPLTERVWDLYWICVGRAAQGNGIGSALLQKIERDLDCQNARAIYLETSDCDTYRAAREFYERHGYARVAHIEDFYACGDGKVIYRKVLHPS